LDTGFEKYYGDEETYLTRFPHLSVDVANTLVKKRIQAVGVDVPRVDKYGSTHFPVHHILLENKILIIEGLSNLKKLKENSDITIITLPLKLCGVGGAPARVIAIQT
jgi:kynurenine formamidase